MTCGPRRCARTRLSSCQHERRPAASRRSHRSAQHGGHLMRLASLLSLLSQARTSSGHAEFVVIGSLSILGMEPTAEIPPGMSMSIDVGAYTRADPERIFDLLPELGEDSPFHRAHGIYLDGVTPAQRSALGPGGCALRTGVCAAGASKIRYDPVPRWRRRTAGQARAGTGNGLTGQKRPPAVQQIVKDCNTSLAAHGGNGLHTPYG